MRFVDRLLRARQSRAERARLDDDVLQLVHVHGKSIVGRPSPIDLGFLGSSKLASRDCTRW